MLRLCEEPNHFQFCYDSELSIEEKLNAIVTKVYRGAKVVLADSAKKQAKRLTELGLLVPAPICMAKNAVQLFWQPEAFRSAERLYCDSQKLKGICRSRLYRSPDGRYYDYARPSEGSGSRKD